MIGLEDWRKSDAGQVCFGLLTHARSHRYICFAFTSSIKMQRAFSHRLDLDVPCVRSCSKSVCSPSKSTKHRPGEILRTKAGFTCQPYRAVAIEPVSTNRLLENGNFCGYGWRLSGDSRQSCRN